MHELDFIRRQTAKATSVLKWAAILSPISIGVGSAVALFLWSLDRATQARFDYPWLIYLMPLAGFFMVLVYQHFGGKSDGGNNLIVDQIHEPGGGVPLRMAPFILVSTVLTHLVGGSAGREGTAVQMGGAIASGVARLIGLSPQEMRIVLMAGIAAGFGAVFGTPIAGAVFALEVLTIGRVQYDALLPAFGAALMADWTVQAWGVTHTQYHITYVLDHVAQGLHVNLILIAKVALAGILFGLAARFFAEASHFLAAQFKRWVPYAPLRPVIAGLVLIGFVHLLGTRAYLGLGVWTDIPGDATIPGFFVPGNIDYQSWFWKTVFTVITLSAGFKGGEVTPLFFIGAAMGNALGGLMGAPTDLMAAVGFVAVFAGATNTPLACMIMGIELFGATHAVPLAIGCFLAYVASGHSSIYVAQRLGVPKTHSARVVSPDLSIRAIHEARRKPKSKKE